MESGTKVTSHLELVRELERGSMGSVWVAFNHSLQTEVAVKFMAPQLAADQKFVARFIREARAAAKMKTGHVVKIQEIAQSDEGVPYIAMELLEGQSLKGRLAEKERLDPEEVETVVKHVGRALKEAHQLEIIHRDIKPANIFLSEQDDELYVKLIDFGVAKQMKDGLQMTQTYDKMGTPFYMAPEQLISAKHVDRRADLWSVGVVAYHCLVGKVPFFANGLADLCVAVATCEYTPVTQARPDLPSGLDAWFSRLLVRDVDARFDSAKEVSAAFTAAIRG
jgi:serine/threonine-protein kinase